MNEKVKRADEQMKLADRLNRDKKDECAISQLKIMDLDKRWNLTEKDIDIVEHELVIIRQKGKQLNILQSPLQESNN